MPIHNHLILSTTKATDVWLAIPMSGCDEGYLGEGAWMLGSLQVHLRFPERLQEHKNLRRNRKPTTSSTPILPVVITAGLGLATAVRVILTTLFERWQHTTPHSHKEFFLQ
jgi:hypothetical protein